jgi:predicted transcriptional regulator
MEKQRELSDPLTMRLPRDILEEIEIIAKASERTRSWVIVRALKYYLGGEGREILENVKAREELAAGLGHDLDDVLAEIDAIIEGKAA